jgi:diguanylate cyclase
MNSEEEKTIVNNWGLAAIKSMKLHEILPMPENYAIWFEYHRGSNPKLNSKIDKMLASGQEFTRDLSREIYNHFILNQVSANSVASASEQVQKIMQTVLNVIDNSVSGATSYNQDLAEFSTDLQGLNIAEAEKMSELVARIVIKTNALKDEGEKLSSKLIESQREVGELKTDLEEVTLQVSLDALTGIANRKAFDDSFARQIDDARESKKSLCLLMLDVDHFKKFNDTYGHLLGDQVLRIVASAIKSVIRGGDFCARFGGEEFVVILPDTPLQGGKIVAENIRKAIAQRELKRKDTGESYGKVTVSAGIAVYNAAFDNAESMIERADKGLYLSKEKGRNMVSVAEV